MRTKLLILGGGGMLGHKALHILSRDLDTWATFRKFGNRFKSLKFIDKSKIVDNVNAFSIESIEKAIQLVKPDIVLNCIGIIKQLKESTDSKKSIFINSYMPHVLAEYCERNHIKFIHISTDCVFNGIDGNYREDSISNAEDLYGRSKYLGEVYNGSTLTLRTSIIGHELFSSYSLVDWFINNSSQDIEGYTNAIYTGLPTCIFINEIYRLIKYYPKLSGLYHVASEPITKYDLLCKINEIYCLNKTLLSNDKFICNRSMNYNKYKIETNYKPLLWKEMITSMYNDYIRTNYKLMKGGL